MSCLDHSLQLFIAYLFFSFSRCGHSSFVVGCFHPCRLCYNNNELQGENSTPRAVSYRLLARSWGQGESTTWRGPRTSMPRAQEQRQPATQSCLWLSAVVLWVIFRAGRGPRRILNSCEPRVTPVEQLLDLVVRK